MHTRRGRTRQHLCGMKKLLLVLSFSSMVLGVAAQGSGFGLGIVLGEPTGLSAKLWTDQDRALAFGLAWGGLGSRGGYFHANADYLFHNFTLIPVSKGRLVLHYGPGIRLRSWSNGDSWNNGRDRDGNGHTRFGIRFPVGLTYLFEGAPVDVFLEVAPALDLIPGTSFDVDGGLGFRYFFGK